MTNLRRFAGKNILLIMSAGLIALGCVVGWIGPCMPGSEKISELLLNAGWRGLLLGSCFLLLNKHIPAVTSAGLMALVFAVDRSGLGLVGVRGLSVGRIIGTIKVMFVVGACLLLLRKHITGKNISELFKSFLYTVRLKLKDIGLVISIFGIAVTVVVFYLHTVDKNSIGLSYPFYQFISPHGILFGLSIVFAYGIFRLGMGQIISFVCSFAFIVSSYHLRRLYFFPAEGSLEKSYDFLRLMRSIYDYSKVPFILAIVFIMGLLVSKPLKRARLFCLSVLGGMVLGLGVLVREDLLVFILPFILLLLFFLPGSVIANIKIKAVALILLASGFLLFIKPTRFLMYQSRGSLNAVHGLMTLFNDNLGITSPGYDWGYIYQDEFAYAISQSQIDTEVPPHFKSYKWNSVGFNYLSKIARNFPADMLTRVYASILKILELPFIYTGLPVKTTNNLVLTFYSMRAHILNLLAGSGLLLSIVALLMICIHSLRMAITCLCFLLFFAGYPALQFTGRHYFHLEFITLWTLGFVFQHSAAVLGQLVHSSKSGGLAELFAFSNIQDLWKTYGKRLCGFTVGSLVVILVPLFVLRQYQSWNVANLFREYSNAERERLPLVQSPLENNAFLVTSPGQFKAAPKGTIYADLLVAEFSAEQCDYTTVWPVLRYANNHTSWNFSRSVSINLTNSDTATTQIYFPAIFYNYFVNWSEISENFIGIEMPPEQVSCLRALYRIKDPSHLPLLMTVIMSNPDEYPLLYQTITAWESDNIHTVPSNMPDTVVKNLLRRPVTSLTADDVEFLDKIVNIGVDRWVVNGYATIQSNLFAYWRSDKIRSILARASCVDMNVSKIDTDLLITKATLLRKGTYFIAQGELYTGGVTFGLIKDGRTAGYVSVVAKGPFTVIIEVPEDGLYTLAMANDLSVFTSLENRFVLTKVGWINDRNKLSRR